MRQSKRTTYGFNKSSLALMNRLGIRNMSPRSYLHLTTAIETARRIEQSDGKGLEDISLKRVKDHFLVEFDFLGLSKRDSQRISNQLLAQARTCKPL